MSVKDINGYIEEAENTIFKIIATRQEDKDAFVQGQVEKYQSSCRKRGITKPQQEEIIQVQAGKFFKGATAS